MGQRQQLYIALPFETELPDSKKSTVIGVHNQWLYGATSIEQLGNVLSFAINQDKYGPFRDSIYKTSAIEAIKATWGVNAATGYWHSLCVLNSDECSNPDNGDCNDGVVIIDARVSDNIKFCYMWIDHCDYDERVVKYTPLSCRHYLETYYSDEWAKTQVKHHRERIERDTTLTEEESVKELQKFIRETYEELEEARSIADRVDAMAPVLSPDELVSIFPALATKIGKRKA